MGTFGFTVKPALMDCLLAHKLTADTKTISAVPPVFSGVSRHLVVANPIFDSLSQSSSKDDDFPRVTLTCTVRI